MIGIQILKLNLQRRNPSRVVDTVTHLDLSTAGKFKLHRTSRYLYSSTVLL